MKAARDVLAHRPIATVIWSRVSAQFKAGGELSDEFLDVLAAELDALKEWKNPQLEAIDGKVYRALLGGAAAMIWALLRGGHLGAHPAKPARRG